MRSERHLQRKSSYEKTLKRVGLPPGSLIHIGEKRAEKVRITLIHYDQDGYEEKVVETIEECFPIKGRSGITWVNVDGLHQVDVIEKLGVHLGTHPLTMEDILNTGERPKMEETDEYIFVILKMLYHGRGKNEITAEQVSLVLGSDYVVTFQETVGDVFDPVRDRLRSGKGRMRRMGPDYLAFALIDAIVDNYFVILESIGERMEALEEAVVEVPTRGTLTEIHRLRRELLFLRKMIWPLREVINCFERSESEFVKETTKIYLRDVYDHSIQVIDNVETFRDMFSNLLEIYVSSISNRMNEIMKVLTIIATIFIPLTFITGVYGMNFSLHFPPLDWELGFLAIMLLNLGIALTMLAYFRRKKWI
nr:magnesium/cobalt transporter CorA [Candidatus Njordarchaeota archaeon]